MMQTDSERTTEGHALPEQRQRAENRWCERHGYFIDMDACRARARRRRFCGRCLARWRQLSLPFPPISPSGRLSGN
ncbi:MAG: hypothetical protein KJ936_13410 [Proteobacteria bacterium]|nr:hypothetical protein [Pseudomonadota bacterium]MBU2228638.1 hypothetical protein [Pseudomonadota bacterium]MBU2261712.1 hypothetical protein [Pseudomonadota bacterium]